jgi:hypothetical protein
MYKGEQKERPGRPTGPGARTLAMVAAVVVVAAAILGAVLAFSGGSGSDKPANHQGRLDRLVPSFQKWGCAYHGSKTPAVAERADCAPGDGIASMQLTLFDDRNELQAAYRKQIRRANASSPSPIAAGSGGCSPHEWGGEAAWTYADGTEAGRRLCYITAEPKAYLTWTYHSVPLLVSANRADPLHDRLGSWFGDVAASIGPSPHVLERVVPLYARWGCHAIAPATSTLKEEAVCAPSEASHGKVVRAWRDRGAQRVDIRLFRSKDDVVAAYSRQLVLANAASPTSVPRNGGACDARTWNGDIAWYHAPNFPAGRQLCFSTAAGGSRLVWTYGDTPLLISAARDDARHGLLRGWFNSVAHNITFTYFGR